MQIVLLFRPEASSTNSYHIYNFVKHVILIHALTSPVVKVSCHWSWQLHPIVLSQCYYVLLSKLAADVTNSIDISKKGTWNHDMFLTKPVTTDRQAIESL